MGQLSELVPDGKVVGIDASAGMIAAVQSRSKPNLTFVQMDMNDMDFQNEFDVIFSNAAPTGSRTTADSLKIHSGH
ncbi:MAG TPA: class I SAM-dependent methyltransferase [Lachnoclostridium phocaeense]|uniref:Class I SAM-dependent methyltransferase n=1 Tax=Lachnoclostridium phocaeense TaxID=1871021 RepID=A0A921I4T2_9FIRM|nr:class I SAM-dependent methyltransferase [Lachnoclostridium phocaeense]